MRARNIEPIEAAAALIDVEVVLDHPPLTNPGLVAAAVDGDLGEPGTSKRSHLILALAVPLGLAALAYALWWISDRLLYVGPLDRAAFGWIVVMPTWILAPVVSGLAWRRLTPRGGVVAAAIVGLAISGIAAVLFWLSVAYPHCDFGDVHKPGDWILPSLTLGLVIGGGFAVSGLIATRPLREGRPWRAVLLGGGAHVVMVATAIVLGGLILVLSGPGCERPPVL